MIAFALAASLLAQPFLRLEAHSDRVGNVSITIEATTSWRLDWSYDLTHWYEVERYDFKAGELLHLWTGIDGAASRGIDRSFWRVRPAWIDPTRSGAKR